MAQKGKGSCLHAQRLHNILENKLVLYIFSLSILIFAYHSKLINFLFFFNLANRKGTILFTRLTSVKDEIKWSLMIRNWHRSHQGCDFSSYR